MNYYLNVYKIPILFLSVLLIIIPFFFIFNNLFDKLNHHFNFSKSRLIILAITYVFISIILPILIVFTLHDFLSDGKISDIYILNKKNETRLIVWFTRIDTPAGISIVYSQRLKSFDINNGSQLSKQNLVGSSPIDDYSIWGPFDNKAWGYCKKTGIQFIDLYQPKILFTEKDILRKNLQLGKTVRIPYYMYKSAYDHDTHGLYIVNSNGIIYKIDTDLKAFVAGEIKNNKTEYRKDNLQDWVIEDINGSEKKIIHASGKKISESYNTFFSPSIIKNLIEDHVNKNKIWIMHWSSNDKKADCLISYINDCGQEINSIKLKTIFKNKMAKPSFTALFNGEFYVFVTIEGYTLSALKTDLEKGKLLNRINYF